MPDNAEIRFVFVDEGGGTGQPGPTGGPSQPTPGQPSPVGWSAASAAQTAATAAAAAAASAKITAQIGRGGGSGGGGPPVIDGRSGAIMPFTGGSPRIVGGAIDQIRPQQIWTGVGQGGPSTLLNALTALASKAAIVGAAFNVLTTAIDSQTIRIQTRGNVKAAFIAGDVLGAAEAQAVGNQALIQRNRPSFLGAVGVGAGAGALAGGPAGALVGGLAGVGVWAGGVLLEKGANQQVSSIQEFAKETKAMREKIAILGQFNAPLAGQLARNEAQEIGRTIAESQASSPQMTRLARVFGEFEQESQIQAFLKRQEIAAEQEEKSRKLSEGMAKENNELAKKLGADVAKIVEEMRKPQKTGVEKILDGIEFDPDMRGEGYGEIMFERPGFAGV